MPSPGIVFRHQQNASMNGERDGSNNSLQRFYGYKETFNDRSIWVDVPQQRTFTFRASFGAVLTYWQLLLYISKTRTRKIHLLNLPNQSIGRSVTSQGRSMTALIYHAISTPRTTHTTTLMDLQPFQQRPLERATRISFRRNWLRQFSSSVRHPRGVSPRPIHSRPELRRLRT